MEFTHLDKKGQAIMVDIGDKPETLREAIARGSIFLSEDCLQKIISGKTTKGDVFGAARIAGIMAAKQTPELIPLCHPVNITGLAIEFAVNQEELKIEAVCRAKTIGRTGVEMEALTGLALALLTIYDMCKAIDKTMEIGEIYLSQKSGGQSGDYCWGGSIPTETEIL